MPFLIGSGSAGSGLATAVGTRKVAAVRPAAERLLVIPVAQAAVNEFLRNSRRVGRPIYTPQRNFVRSIFGSHTSVDFSVSSQVTSRPVYAAVRAIMHESADSAPLSV